MKLSELVAAFEQGKTVQWEGKPGVWADKQDNSWDSRYNYRVKPPPLECWVNFYSDGNRHAHMSEPQARAMASLGATRIAVRMTLVEVV